MTTTEENPFKKYQLWTRDEHGSITGVNPEATALLDESFELFRSLYNTHYGSIIEEDHHLISIHTGGWSDNELLISQFKESYWWWKYHQITAKGGHYYFNLDRQAKNDWTIKPSIP